MKKIILLATVLVSTFAQAQIISVTGHNGEPITEGYTFTTDALSGEEADLPIRVENLTEETIYVKLRMVSMVNADNMPNFSVQFCFGELCYYQVETGDTVPTGIDAAEIAPGEENPEGDHFINGYAGDVAGTDVVYNLRLVQFDAANNEIGTLMNFKYVYSTTAGITDLNGLQNLGISVKNTVVEKNMDIDATIMANLAIIDVNGKSIKNVSINEGANTIDLSGLSAGVYFAKFTTGMNKSSQIKIVKN